MTGYPLEHSLSPQLHRRFLRQCGLEGEYRLYPCPPASPECLRDLVAALRREQLHGLNVTVPHKRRLLALVEDLTPAAQAIGAVNTLFLQDGRLWGDNTDAPAFWDDLQAGGLAAGKRALLLGAGGAARAVAWVLREKGWSVWVMARNETAAAALVDAFALRGALGWLEAAPRVDVLVNCTPVGMWPQQAASPWPDDRPLPAAAVYDLVYNPAETRLLAQARAQDLPARNGWGMLQRQAARAFARWTACPDLRL